MARPIKTGLDYFSHACYLDDELEYIIAVHKETGYYIYFRLLERIYKNLGYYINWDKKNIALFANNINVDINKVNDIINDCLSEHLFNKSIHKKHNILTSKGIQERYFEAIDRRKEAEIIKDYIILKDVYINKLNVNIIWINVDKSTQSKVEYSKVEENKEIEFIVFWDNYHTITKKNKTDKEAALKYWKKLSEKEKQKAIDNIKDYYDSLGDKKYCKKARTYLDDKNFNDEFNKPKKKTPHPYPEESEEYKRRMGKI